MNDKIKSKIEELKTLHITNDIQKIYDDVYTINTDAGVPDNNFIFYIVNENGRLWYDLPQCEKDKKQTYYNQEIIFTLLFTLSNDKSIINYILENANDFDGKIIDLFKKQRFNFQKNKKILDLGSHQGIYALNFSKFFNEVICVEPFVQNYLTIELNVLANDIKNIKVIPSFISNEHKIGKFSQSEQKFINVENYPYECIIQKSSTLDDFAYFNPDVIKMDIEGEELNAFQSAEKILESNPSLVIELHKELDSENKLDYNIIKKNVNINKYIAIGIKHKSNIPFLINSEYDLNLIKYLFLIKN